MEDDDLDFDGLDGLDYPVTLISFGSAEWQRWMIYHRRRRRWWGHGTWRQHQRDGEMWDDFDEADEEFRQADQYRFGVEDE